MNKSIYRLLSIFVAFVLVLGNSYNAGALPANDAGTAANKYFSSLGNQDWNIKNAQPYKNYFTLTHARTIKPSAIMAISSAVNDEIHWTITGLNSVTLDWRGPSNALRFGITTAYGQTATAAKPSPLPFSSAGPFWEAKLTNLQPNTTYHYSIGGEADHTFKTALPKGSSGFTVDVIGDVGDTTSYANVGPVQGMIASDQPSLALVVGDLTYGNAHGQAAVDQHFNDVQAWSLGSTAYMPAWGNHEWDSPASDNLNNYKGRFDLPNPQTSPGSPAVSCCGEDWYYFDYGNTRFIAYPEPWSGAWSDWNTRATTLMNQAQADPTITFIVTFGHRPAYSSGHHPGDSSLQSYLNKLGATHSKYVLNLNGHSHNYERTFPQSNVVHITAGIGGASLEQDGTCLWLTCTKPTWSAKRYMHLGILKLTFNASSIQGAFICGPSGGGTNDISCTKGTVIDTFTIGNSAGSQTQTMTISKGGTGSGTVTSSPAGISCGSTCSYAFASNTVVTLTATPTSPSTFGGWSGGGCSGAGTCIVTMSSAQSVTATFTIQNGPVYPIDISIAGANQGSYNVPKSFYDLVSYPGVMGGPLYVDSTTGQSIVTSIRLLYNNKTLSELMGVPSSQLSDDYSMPAYVDNGTNMDSQIRFTNTSSTTSTTVQVYLGGTLMGTYPLGPSSAARVKYAGVSGGPVRIVGTPGVPILAGMRIIYGGNSSFDEMMAYPTAQLASEYWFPFYTHNNANLISDLRIANTSSTQSSTVNVFVAGTGMGTYTLLPNTFQIVSYPGVIGGPVRVAGSVGVPIIASMGLLYNNKTYSELMGVPTSQLLDDYSMPVYLDNNMDMDSQIRFTNTSSTTSTTVQVYLGGTLMGTYPLGPSSAARVRFAGVSSGPIRIVGTAGVPILAGMRIIYGGNSSFDEIMAYPTIQLDSKYWFPYYSHNQVNLDTEVRMAVP